MRVSATTLAANAENALAGLLRLGRGTFPAEPFCRWAVIIMPAGLSQAPAPSDRLLSRNRLSSPAGAVSFLTRDPWRPRNADQSELMAEVIEMELWVNWWGECRAA